MEAIAFDSLTRETFEDVLKHGAKAVTGTGCMIVPEWYSEIMESFYDFMMEREVAERLKNPETGGITFEELMAKSGITQEQLDAIPDEEME